MSGVSFEVSKAHTKPRVFLSVGQVGAQRHVCHAHCSASHCHDSELKMLPFIRLALANGLFTAIEK